MLKEVTGCSACGLNHLNVETKPMEPFFGWERLFTRQFICPTNGEPVMISYDDDSYPEDGGVHTKKDEL